MPKLRDAVAGAARCKGTGLGLPVLLAGLLAPVAPPRAAATELVVNHLWSAPSEIAALGVLRAHLQAAGDTWKDLAIPHDTGTNVNIVNMIAGGNPPDVFMEFSPGIFRDLEKQDKVMPLDTLLQQTGALANMPDVVKRAITVDGKIVKLPTDIHVDGAIFYNKHVADAAGINPKSWKSLDDFFADFDKVKAAGYIPLAIGGQQWQIGFLFHSLMAALTGNAIFDRIYSEKPDRAAIDTPEMRQTFDMLRRFQQHTDPGSTNRTWNDTTNLVITGKALLQLHGDWMKGEFRAAGKTIGVDYDCMNIPGMKGATLTIDEWGLLRQDDPAKTKAEEDFVRIDVDPQVQADFAAQKGSTPMRLDAPRTKFDTCNDNADVILKNPALQHPTPHNTTDADWENGIWEVASRFWTTPGMTDDQAIAALQKTYDQIF